jgi:hypothetical protein
METSEMTKSTLKMTLALAAAGLFASAAHAGPLTLNEAQLDSVAAGGVETTDGFVCPVIKTDAVLNSDKGGVIGTTQGGDTVYYTIGGPNVTVPEGATNEGFPGEGNFLTPGDVGYTAIWNLDNAP